MRYLLEIHCDGSAFGDDDAARRDEELARILRVAAERIEGGAVGPLFDANGNRVGSARFEVTR